MRPPLHCFFTVLCLSFTVFLHAQGGIWTWMKGSSVTNAAGNYGVLGVSSPANDPPSMYAALSWTDPAGNFWLYGGLNSSSFQIYSALWRFDTGNLQWTWMNGSSATGQWPVYGTQGVSAPGNTPGARFRGCTWIDANGNLWLFGGYGFDSNGQQGQMSDLWMYNVAINEWTWMKGPTISGQPGSYGTLQVASGANNPPCRHEGNAAWVSANGELWMFGGEGGGGFYSDMWRYDPATNNWTWMSGPNTTNAFPNWGVLQVPAATNTPGSRSSYNHWTDATGNFWLFGGNRFTNTYNDMWRYNPATNQWTWMGGSNSANDPGNYGTFCTAGGFRPSSRMETRTCWKDNCGRFWLMGGSTNNQLNQLVQDMWLYDPVLNEFLLSRGGPATNQPASFGVMGVPAATNEPAGLAGSMSYTALNGDMWMFGGLLNAAGGTSNALWRFQPDLSCFSVQFNLTASPSTGCFPLPVTFQLSPVSNNFNFHWDFGDPATQADTSNLPAPSYVYTSAGTFTVTAIITNNSCGLLADTITTTIQVSAVPLPALGPDTILCGNASLTLDAGYPGASFSWNTGPADTLQTLTINAPGTYGVLVSLANCSGSDSINVTYLQPPNIGNDTTLCEGQPLTLSAGNIWDTYLWSNQTTASTVQPDTTGIWWVQVAAGPCTFTDSASITIHPLPVVNLGPDTTLCPDVVYVLDAGNPNATFSWNTGASTQQVVASQQGAYSVSVTENNCTVNDLVLVNFYPPLDLGPDLNLCLVPELSLDAGPALSYLWNTGETTQTIVANTAGMYSVLLDNGTCQLRDSIEITGGTSSGMLYVPNTFTPNANGTNDYFFVAGDGITQFTMRIYNRWGQLIFISGNMNEYWDGTLNGVKCQNDTYVYIIDYRTECGGENDFRKIGHVNLLR
ncbi:MAG: gliding motility-associated C-terminal domain-containing protein [Bacteroidetes bacterium]|nr:gliding motility-associated C-terminal domain-containing protein [Bacteroidota bacterium]